MAFADKIFGKPSMLDSHRYTKFGIVIHEIFRELLRTKFGADSVTADLSDPVIDSNSILTSNYSIKGPNISISIKLKAVMMETELSFSANFLIVDKDENLVAVDIPFSEEKSFDTFIIETGKIVQTKVIGKIKNGTSESTEQKYSGTQQSTILRPNIPDVYFSRPYNPNPLRPNPEYSNFGPNIRIDPVFPPDIGVVMPNLGQRPPHPDLPDMGQGSGSLMGRNHPFFNRKPNNPDFPPFNGGFF
jgi:hypothetical protein